MPKDERMTQLMSIIKPYKLIAVERFDEEKERMLISYYYPKGRVKKMLFYIISYKGKVAFGINDYKTDILKTIPTLSGFADRQEKYVLKFDIKTLEDIQTKAIAKVVELCMMAIRQRYMDT